MAQVVITISGDTASAVTLLSMTRSDTGGSVAFGSGVFTDAGGGNWTYNFTEPVGDVTYFYTFRMTWPDATFTDGNGSLWVSSVVGWVGDYTSVDDLEKMIGVITVTQLFDLDSDGVRDNGADLAAGESAEAELNLLAGGGVGLIPLDFEATAAGTRGRNIVRGWATGLYAFHAAEKRGLTGVELERWKSLYDRIVVQITAYREGGLTLPGVIEDPNDAADQAGEFAAVEVQRNDLTCVAAGDEFAGL